MSNNNLIVRSNQTRYLTDDIIEHITDCAVHTTLSVINDIEEERLERNPEFAEDTPEHHNTPNEHIVFQFKHNCHPGLLISLENNSKFPWSWTTLDEEYANIVNIYGIEESEQEQFFKKHKISKAKLSKVINFLNEFDEMNDVSEVHGIWNQEHNHYQFFYNVMTIVDYSKPYSEQVLKPLSEIINKLEQITKLPVSISAFDGNINEDELAVTAISWFI